jgi:hypothetical protein
MMESERKHTALSKLAERTKMARLALQNANDENAKRTTLDGT